MKNINNEEVVRLDEPALTALAQWGLAPPGTCWVAGRPYLTIQGMVLLAERLEADGQTEEAKVMRQRIEDRANVLSERMMERGVTGKRSTLIIEDDHAYAPDPDRDPMPGYVRFLIILFMAGAGLIFSLPAIVRELFAIFWRF